MILVLLAHHQKMAHAILRKYAWLVDITEPNIPNTEASILYHSVQFCLIF